MSVMSDHPQCFLCLFLSFLSVMLHLKMLYRLNQAKPIKKIRGGAHCSQHKTLIQIFID